MSGGERPNARPNTKRPTPRVLGPFRRELLVHLAVCQATPERVPAEGLRFRPAKAIRRDLDLTSSREVAISQALKVLEDAHLIKRARRDGDRYVRVTLKGMREAVAIASRYGMTEREYRAGVKRSAAHLEVSLQWTEEQKRDNEAWLANPEGIEGVLLDLEVADIRQPTVGVILRPAEARLQHLMSDPQADAEMIRKLQAVVQHLRGEQDSVELQGRGQRDLLRYYGVMFRAFGVFPLTVLGRKLRLATFTFGDSGE